MIAEDLKPLSFAVDKLRLLPGNPRRGNVEAVRRSLEAFGQRKPIVARRSDRVVIAGNHTLQAAQALGWVEVAVVWVDDDDTTSKAFALADNRTAELGDYDEAALAELIGQVGSVDPDLLVASGWDASAVQELVDRIEPPKSDDDGDVEVPSDPITRLGDLWAVGEHRILCGDSGDIATLDRVFRGVEVGCLLTDPPYGINLDTDYSQGGAVSGRKYRQVLNDDKPFDASLLYEYFALTQEQYWWGADYYRRTIDAAELAGSWLVWDKRVEEAKDNVIGSAFELCWSRSRHQRRILRYQWTNWTSRDNAGNKREHPTEKPIDMLIDILERWAPAKCVVADPFGGSGATLVAAAKTGRIGMGVELDPAYVDVIVRRLERVTGLKASLVHG